MQITFHNFNSSDLTNVSPPEYDLFIRRHCVFISEADAEKRRLKLDQRRKYVLNKEDLFFASRLSFYEVLEQRRLSNGFISSKVSRNLRGIVKTHIASLLKPADRKEIKIGIYQDDVLPNRILDDGTAVFYQGLSQGAQRSLNKLIQAEDEKLLRASRQQFLPF